MSEIAAIPLPPGFAKPRLVPGKVDADTALRTFEAYFTGEMLKRASAPLDEESLLDGGQAGRMYREFLFQELARIVSERGGFGLARALADRFGRTDAPVEGHSQEEVE